MRILQVYSHLNGHEWLSVHHPNIWKEIEAIIKPIDAEKYKTKVSKEKTMKGKLLYSPAALNKRFSEDFKKAEWEESRTSYWVTDDYTLIRRTLHLAVRAGVKEQHFCRFDEQHAG